MLKKVTDWLYLAPPLTRAELLIDLRDMGITHVINASEIENDQLLSDHGFRFLRSRFVDSGRAQEWMVWTKLADFIREARRIGDAKIAIHCVGGPRRSVSVAYLALRLEGVTESGARQFLALRLPGEEPVYAEFVEQWLRLFGEGRIMPKGSE